MKKLNYYNFFCVIVCAIICSSCSYIQHFQKHTQLVQIQNNISTSKLDKINAYTSHAPYHKTYEFEFNNSLNNSYALIFLLSNSRFSQSIIKHRYQSELRRDAIRIDRNKNILTTLEKNLPEANNVHWQLVANHITQEEARDSYHILQEYIRLKIRDL